MFCSTIIPTIGRQSLQPCVESVLDQALGSDSEVIVVNDSGKALPRAGWQVDPRVRIVEFNQGNQAEARNQGARLARGRFLHFLDDDDWLFPNALEELRQVAESNPEAAIVYGTGVLVDDRGSPLAEVNLKKTGNCFSEMVGGSWIQVGQSLVSSKHFLDVGGFDPAFNIAEETHLQREIAFTTDFAHTPAPIVNISRGDSWHTAVDYSSGTRMNRVSRASALARPGAFRRLMDSAQSPYWHGRVLRAYLADARWQLKQSHLRVPIKDLILGILVILRAGSRATQPEFWQALKDDHAPCSQARLLGPSRREQRLEPLIS